MMEGSTVGVGIGLIISINSENVNFPALITRSFFDTPFLDSDKVVKISGGTLHVIFLTRRGSVLTFGSNERGQRGVGFVNTGTGSNQIAYNSVSEVQFFNGDHKPRAIDIAGWADCSVVLCNKGKVYIFGKYTGSLFNTPTVKYMLGNRTFSDILELISDAPSSKLQPTKTESICNQNYILSALNDPETSDVVFSIGGKKIYAHS